MHWKPVPHRLNTSIVYEPETIMCHEACIIRAKYIFITVAWFSGHTIIYPTLSWLTTSISACHSKKLINRGLADEKWKYIRLPFWSSMAFLKKTSTPHQDIHFIELIIFLTRNFPVVQYVSLFLSALSLVNKNENDFVFHEHCHERWTLRKRPEQRIELSCCSGKELTDWRIKKNKIFAWNLVCCFTGV